jgi:type IV pilus assembly protein PilC
MFKFVLPKLVGVLKEQSGDLPFVSIILIKFTDFFDSWWWLVLLALAGAAVFVRFYLGTEQGRYQWDKIKTHIPIIGDIFEKVYITRFARNLATLIAGGIPIIQALKIIAEVINNVVYREILLETATQVTNGKSISDSLVRYKEFPPLVTQMIKVGEQTAQLDMILQKLATFYEKEVDSKVDTLSSLLEPVIMIILGLAVGVLVAGVLLPIYNLASTVG